MTEGFYYIRGKLFYGLYPDEHVSGTIRCSAIKKGNINTDKDYSKTEFAPLFYDNHKLTEQELIDLKNALTTIAEVIGIIITDIDINSLSLAENSLNISFPEEIKILYSFLLRSNPLTEGSERFLKLDEMYVENGNLVFFKSKRTPVAISLNSGLLMRYYKKSWNYNYGDANFLNFTLQKIVALSMTTMPYLKQERIKYDLIYTARAEHNLVKTYSHTAKMLKEYNNCGNYILYGPKSLILFRTNYMGYADLMIASHNQNEFNRIIASTITV